MNANGSDGGACRVTEWVFVKDLGSSLLKPLVLRKATWFSKGCIPHCTIISVSGS